MFRRKPQLLSEVLKRFMRDEGLETPLLQKRLLDSWDEVAGTVAARYTQEKFIKNQTLMVKITNPALRSDMSMMRSMLVQKLNAKVGTFIIADIKFY